MNESAVLPGFDLASHQLQSQSNPLERILVVEDDGDLRRLNAQALSLSGYEVETAVDGAAAWAELQTNSYDLMITDNNMPKVTGVELLVKLRAARMELPVIMASGTSFSDDASRSPWLTALGFIGYSQCGFSARSSSAISPDCRIGFLA